MRLGFFHQPILAMMLARFIKLKNFGITGANLVKITKLLIGGIGWK
jgi:hypothetical protein